MKMNFRDAVELINEALEENKKEHYYKLYLARYPMYNKKTFETFEEFYEKLFPEKKILDMRSKDEIMKDIANAQVKLKGAKNGTI